MLKLAVAGGKGGVTKSSVARGIAVRSAQKGKQVTAYDMDSDQATMLRWENRRANLPDVPKVAVIPVNNPMILRAKLEKTEADVAIIDTGAYWYRDSAKIISMADVVVMPSRYSLDDVDALVRAANELLASGIKQERILIVFSGVLESPAEDKDARTYLESLGFWVAPTFIPFTKSASQAQDAGYGFTENKFAGPRTASRIVLDAILDRAYEVTA